MDSTPIESTTSQEPQPPVGQPFDFAALRPNLSRFLVSPFEIDESGESSGVEGNSLRTLTIVSHPLLILAERFSLTHSAASTSGLQPTSTAPPTLGLSTHSRPSNERFAGVSGPLTFSAGILGNYDESARRPMEELVSPNRSYSRPSTNHEVTNGESSNRNVATSASTNPVNDIDDEPEYSGRSEDDEPDYWRARPKRMSRTRLRLIAEQVPVLKNDAMDMLQEIVAAQQCLMARGSEGPLSFEDGLLFFRNELYCEELLVILDELNRE